MGVGTWLLGLCKRVNFWGRQVDMDRVRDPRILKFKTFEEMAEVLRDKGRPLADFKKGDTIHVWNKMEKGYSYVLEAEPGQSFDPEFRPSLTPGEVLALGAFGGRYLNDCVLEFPAEWFWQAGLLGKLAPGAPPMGDVSLNYFQIDSRLPLTQWAANGWVAGGRKRMPGKKGILGDPKRNPDERGWFQWYCRYWMGRRMPELDAVQIQRWKNFRRHYGAVQKACEHGDATCRPRQRQALLHWAWPFLD
jgi:hypothetical protein